MTGPPGFYIETETENDFGGAITTARNLPSQLLNMLFVAPQCGLIAVKGARRGEVPAVHIVTIKPRAPLAIGHFGAHSGSRRLVSASKRRSSARRCLSA
jgi:hypothetical protein